MENQKMIINRDIWSFNIGLDENLGAKIVDFWWSIYRPSHIDPEYKKTGKVKRALDVYNFGVVLFEILCGRVARDPIYLKESEKGLAPVARQSFNTGTLEDMIDPILREETGESGSQ
ncbi:putative non-specific serine/threonine protein kinase [Helianthus debilis subsp. tardiflorus]